MHDEADLGSCRQTILLTGAGLSANWGGLVADEIWEVMLGHPAVAAHSRVQDVLREPEFNQDFETCLDQVRYSGFNDGEKDSVQVALQHAFCLHHERLVENRGEVSKYGFRQFVTKFEPNESSDTGFVFTLNQDLLLELTLSPSDGYAGICPIHPGVEPHSDYFTHRLTQYQSEKHRIEIGECGDHSSIPVKGQFNYVKLHGSFDWWMPDGRNVIAAGKNKEALSDDFPLLGAYLGLFRQVCMCENTRLLIVGYSFRDPLINKAIAEGVSHDRLQVYIWDVLRATEMQIRVRSQPGGHNIWAGLCGYMSAPFGDAMRGKDISVPEGPVWDRICKEFLDR